MANNALSAFSLSFLDIVTEMYGPLLAEEIERVALALYSVF